MITNTSGSSLTARKQIIWWNGSNGFWRSSRINATLKELGPSGINTAATDSFELRRFSRSPHKTRTKTEPFFLENAGQSEQESRSRIPPIQKWEEKGTQFSRFRYEIRKQKVKKMHLKANANDVTVADGKRMHHFLKPPPVHTTDYRCDDGWFLLSAQAPSIVKFQTQLPKTWIWNDRFRFMELQILNISTHRERTNSYIAWKLNSGLTLWKYSTEKAILGKLGLAIDKPVRASFLRLQMNDWLLRIIKGKLGIMESSTIQWCPEVISTCQFCFYRRICSLRFTHGSLTCERSTRWRWPTVRARRPWQSRGTRRAWD